MAAVTIHVSFYLNLASRTAIFTRIKMIAVSNALINKALSLVVVSSKSMTYRAESRPEMRNVAQVGFGAH